MENNTPKVSIKEFLSDAKLAEESRLPLIMWGPTGSGKTDAAIQLAKGTDRILRIYYPSGMEPTDLSGLPIDNPEIELVEFRKTNLIHFDPNQKYILFIDEFNRAPLDVQQALVPLWNPIPYVGVHEIKADVWIITAMNNTEFQNNVNVTEVDDAILTRSGQYTIVPRLGDVADYLQSRYPDSLFAPFLSSQYIADAINMDFGNIYKDDTMIKATARNLEKACQIFNGVTAETIDSDSPKSASYFRLLQSVGGHKLVAGFASYLRELERMNPEDLFKSSKTVKQKLTKMTDEMTTSNTTLLLTAFQGGLQPDCIDKKSTVQIKNYLNNLMLIAKDSKGKAAYRDVIGAVFATIRDKNIQKVHSIQASDEYIDFFLEFYEIDLN